MSGLGTKLRGLVGSIDPRLVPVIVLLLAGLVAVPFLLRDDAGAPPAPVAAAPVADPSAGSETDGVAQPVVAAGKPQRRGRRLGKRVNPFKAGAAKDAGGDDPKGLTGTAVSGAKGGGDAGGGGGGEAGAVGDGGLPGTGTPPAATPTDTPDPRASAYDAVVTFGPVGFDVDPEPLRRLAGVPGVRRPALLYMGLGPDRDAAVFLVAPGVAVVGGTCWPSATDCKQVALGVGDEVRFTPPGGDRAYLRLKAVRERKLPVDAARDVREAEADGGRAALRTLLDRVGNLRYDTARGTLEALDGRMRSRP